MDSSNDFSTASREDAASPRTPPLPCPKSGGPRAEDQQQTHGRSNKRAQHHHISYRTLDDVTYQRFPPGRLITILGPNGEPAPEPTDSSHILVTRGATAYWEGKTPEPPRHCAHYHFCSVCQRGPRCDHIHIVHVDPDHPTKSQRPPMIFQPFSDKDKPVKTVRSTKTSPATPTQGSSNQFNTTEGDHLQGSTSVADPQFSVSAPMFQVEQMRLPFQMTSIPIMHAPVSFPSSPPLTIPTLQLFPQSTRPPMMPMTNPFVAQFLPQLPPHQPGGFVAMPSPWGTAPFGQLAPIQLRDSGYPVFYPM